MIYAANIRINCRKPIISLVILCFIDNQNLVMNSITILSFSDGFTTAPSR